MKPAPRLTVTPMTIHPMTDHDSAERILGDLAYDLLQAASVLVFLAGAIVLAVGFR